MGFPIQTLIVQKANSKKHKITSMDAPVSLVNPDGTAFTGGGSTASYTLKAATTSALGGVKQGTAVADVTSADSAAAAADAVTKAEFDAVVTELNETKKQFNAALAALRTAGVIAAK